MYKNIKIFLISILTFVTFSANAANLENIEPIDTKTIKTSLDTQVTFWESEVSWDVKILRDIEVSYSSLDFENSKKVLINLSSDLYTNADYSLISVVGSEWSIDFTLWSSLDWELENYYLNSSSKNIEKVNILDSRTIEVYYNYDITETDFEYKLLWDLSVKNLSSDTEGNLLINLNTSLEQNRNYILMVISLEDSNWDLVSLDESLYDFSTDNTISEYTWNIEENQEVQEIVMEEKITQDIENVLDKKEQENAIGNLEEVSLNAAATPETWAATYILILATIFISFFFVSTYKNRRT